MRKIYKRWCFALLPVLFPLLAIGQTDEPQEAEWGARLSASAEKKLARGLRVSLEEEVRLDDNFTSFNRLQTTIGLKYKVGNHLRVGVGYAMINGYSSKQSQFKSARHRLMVEGTGFYRTGQWELSLRERLQFTIRTGDFNAYQSPRTAIMLKSRLQVKYKGMGHWVPSASCELRSFLNAPAIVAQFDGTNYLTESGSQTGEAGWFLGGWSNVYNNRVRLAVGTDYKLNKHSTLNATLLLDYVNDKVVDANSSGTRLKSYTRETGWVAWLTAGF